MTVEYREGPYVGYRYYDTANVPVAAVFNRHFLTGEVRSRRTVAVFYRESFAGNYTFR